MWFLINVANSIEARAHDFHNYGSYLSNYQCTLSCNFLWNLFLLAVDLTGQEATIGTDVRGSSFPVRFRSGQTQVFLQLYVVDDAILESTETFTVHLLSPIRGIIQEPDEAIVTIFDDECKMIMIFFQ